MTSTVPVWQAELSKATTRGKNIMMMVCIFVFFFFLQTRIYHAQSELLTIWF